MDIIEVIVSDHAAAAALFDEVEPLALDDRRSSDVMRQAVRLAVTMKVHCHAEEKVLYEAMRTCDPALVQLAREGPYEHQILDMMLDKLVCQRPGHDLLAILHVARHEFEHHALDEEERVMLPALRAAFDVSERVQLGLDMLAEKRRIRTHIERLVGPAPRAFGDSVRDTIRVNHHLRPRH